MEKTAAGAGRRGRPPGEAAQSHAAIMDAVYQMLQETPVRDLTLEAVARRAHVGRPTLYKWWPSKSALILAMFHERIGSELAPSSDGTVEEILRSKVRFLIRQFHGFFGKVMADLIAEGQSDPGILSELYERHMRARREATVAEIERGKANGEFAADLDPELLIDAIFGPIYFRLLLRSAPLTEQYGEELVTQTLRGARPAAGA
ncbi:TetR family transcriptional regulator [Capsulimonas corticalis]|uniref:TetR family transcriptional regulator n=1 Tax=Capsulimonas corticalis TaxID=2219043 RepID=A0A402D0R1_9BACT|nr:TetR/AcrR family transcriptional regulator [Capsulimonas corticalis]BDI33528.1 TetR family transcriptional regulator [Capsulimonas corticalis]